MEGRCIRQTELPNTSHLFADYLYHFDRVSRFYGGGGDFAEAAARIDYPEERRQALVAALRERNGDSATLDLLARSGTVAVVTGQQVGLFSGPSYTIYKALTAVKLARELTGLGINAAPVFWLATEDHDFAEVNHCWVFDGERRPLRLELQETVATGGPVGRIVPGRSPVGELREALSGLPFGEDVADRVEAAYRPGRTLGEAFAELLKNVLAGFGLLYLDPLQPAMRELASPLLVKASRHSAELNRLLLERNEELKAAGYHAQVHVEPESSLLFLLDGGRRTPLARLNGAYTAGGRRFTEEELEARAADLSPNALLRPVVQDSILPTVAYVGGPAELAYLAQSRVLYDELLGRAPVALSRAGFTIVDARADKLLGRYGLSLQDFFHGEGALTERIAARLAPEPLGHSLKQAAERTDREIDLLSVALGRFDRTLAEALERSRRKILYQFGKMERKVAREALRRDERAVREAQWLNSLVYPERHPQERLYSILPFLAAHGPGLPGRIYESIRLDCPDHQLLVV